MCVCVCACACVYVHTLNFFNIANVIGVFTGYTRLLWTQAGYLGHKKQAETGKRWV